ncbi:hypothetical protein SALBM311S_00973 [Streptomyces alboniger]
MVTRRHAGACVAEPTEQEGADLLEMRVLLEPLGASRAAQRRTEAHLKVLRGLVRLGQERARRGTSDDLRSLGSWFHETLAQASGSPAMTSMLTQLRHKIAWMYAVDAPANPVESWASSPLAPQMPRPGRIGLFAQSGAIGIALLSRLHRRGGGVTGVTGVSTFVSSGNRADVSGNDVLQYWYHYPDTDVVLMYLESIGNPRKFTRLARRTAAAKPLVVVQGVVSRILQGHAVRATRLPHATVSALLRQAGVIRVETITELVDTGLLLARQPLPTGARVAILGNSESLGLLTYDVCLSEGLRPSPLLDLTTGASPGDFQGALSRALADEACDAVVVTAIPTVGEGSAWGRGAGRGTEVRRRAGPRQAGAGGPRGTRRTRGSVVGRGEHRTAGGFGDTGRRRTRPPVPSAGPTGHVGDGRGAGPPDRLPPHPRLPRRRTCRPGALRSGPVRRSGDGTPPSPAGCPSTRTSTRRVPPN